MKTILKLTEHLLIDLSTGSVMTKRDTVIHSLENALHQVN